MSLMEFGGQFKMTSYVFAPKDDPYHTSKWRQLYPQEEIEAIAEMVEVGNANKCRFVWTAHPFMGGFNSSDVDGEIKALLAKFDQLYGAGVRQFGVLGDDVGNLNREIVIRVMNAVSEWAAEKGDVYDSVFCPAGYNHSWQGDYSELNTYDAGFPDDVQIFWTGEAVCQPIIQQTLNHFRNQNATNGSRRAPLFWLNWPVNDINHSRMLMGKGSLLHTDINPDDLVGVVTNPMQEAEPSKVAIFAVADYAWNVADFNADKSWADSFAYIDADAAEELHTLAKHMSDPSPNGHGLNLAESEELLPLINGFKAALSSGTSLKEVGAKLVEEMQVIIDACDNFHAKSKNERMKEQLLPFTNSLKDLATAIQNYTLAAMELEDNNGSDAFGYYSVGFEAHDGSKKHTKQAKDGIEYVDPGSKHLMPLADTIKEAIADEVTAYVFGEAGSSVELTASSSFNSFYDGNINNIIDGKDNTHAWYGGYEDVGQFYQVNLSETSTLYGVNILNGTASKPEDTFGVAEVQYTTDGTNWKEIMTLGSQTEATPGELEGTDNINDVLTNHEISYNTESVDGLDLKVRYLKFEITKTKVGPDKWVRFQEFEINGGAFISDVNDPTVEGQGEAVDNRYKFMTDADITTKYTFDSELVYHQSEENVNTVKFVQSGVSNATVKVRLAGEEAYRTLGTLDQVICEQAINGQIVDVKIVPVNDKQVSITEMMFSYSEDAPDLEPEKEEVCKVFPDVKHGAWYETSVQYVYDKELMTGSNGLFKPGDEVSRAQFVTTLYRLAGSPAVTDDSACKEFPDVLTGKYYTDAVCWAYANGITTGSNGMFNTAGKLSRQQLATFLYRFAEYMNCDVTAEGDYSDMLNADQVAAYAEKAMKWAVGAGVISGSQKTDATGAVVYDLNPKGNTTRAQLAAILERFCEGNNL